MIIKKVNAADSFEAIGEIYASSWKAAYQDIIPQDYLDGLNGSRWAGVIAKSQYTAFVVMDGEKYAGTSSIAPARDEGLEGWGEIVSIYMRPEYFGRGYAGPLLEYVIGALAERGYSDIYLWVLSENVRARRFYEKNGFQKKDHTKNINIGGTDLTEVRYIRHLSRSSNQKGDEKTHDHV